MAVLYDVAAVVYLLVMVAPAAGDVVSISIVVVKSSNLQPSNVIAASSPIFHLQRTRTSADYVIKLLLPNAANCISELALSVTFLFVYEISRQPLNGYGFAPNS